MILLLLLILFSFSEMTASIEPAWPKIEVIWYETPSGKFMRVETDDFLQVANELKNKATFKVEILNKDHNPRKAYGATAIILQDGVEVARMDCQDYIRYGQDIVKVVLKNLIRERVLYPFRKFDQPTFEIVEGDITKKMPPNATVVVFYHPNAQNFERRKTFISRASNYFFGKATFLLADATNVTGSYFDLSNQQDLVIYENGQPTLYYCLDTVSFMESMSVISGFLDKKSSLDSYPKK